MPDENKLGLLEQPPLDYKQQFARKAYYKCILLEAQIGRGFTSLEPDIIKFFDSNPIFYQYKPNRWGALYIEAFTELEEAIKVMKDADIAALNSKVVGLHQEASALNVQMVDKEEVKSAALDYIRSKESSIVPKVVTQSIELVKWGVDVADLMDNPDSIKDLSSAFFF